METIKVKSKDVVKISTDILERLNIKVGDELVVTPKKDSFEIKKTVNLSEILPLKTRVKKIKDVHALREIAKRQAVRRNLV